MSAAGKPPDATQAHRREALADRQRAERAQAGGRLRWLRKLLFGDWTPVLRDPLDLLRLSFAVASVVFLVTGHGAIAWHMFIDFLIVVAAGRLNMPRLADLLFVLGWATQSWGNAAGLFDLNQCTNIRLGKANHVCLGYDNFVHLVIPLTQRRAHLRARSAARRAARYQPGDLVALSFGDCAVRGARRYGDRVRERDLGVHRGQLAGSEPPDRLLRHDP